MHDVDKVRDDKNVTLYRHEIGWVLSAALCTACAAHQRTVVRVRLCIFIQNLVSIGPHGAEL